MAKEMKIAHDYFLDCCKKYGVEVVSDRKVRSHYETTVRYDNQESTEKSLSAYGQGNEKKIGMTVFRSLMAGFYISKKDPATANYWLHELRGKDILYEPKPKQSDLMEIFKLLDKALTIADKGKDIPQDVFEKISTANGLTFRYLKGRGEL